MDDNISFVFALFNASWLLSDHLLNFDSMSLLFVDGQGFKAWHECTKLCHLHIDNPLLTGQFRGLLCRYVDM